MLNELKVEYYRESAVTTYQLIFTTTGWAYVYMDNGSGNVCINSDWGNWAYRWNMEALGSYGKNPSVEHKHLETFFLDADDDYLARKLRGSEVSATRRRVWDPDATKERIELLIAEYGSENGLGETWHDQMLDDLEWLEWGIGEDVFLHSASGSDIADIVPELYNEMVYEPDSDLAFLKGKFLPVFKGFLREHTEYGREFTAYKQRHAKVDSIEP